MGTLKVDGNLLLPAYDLLMTWDEKNLPVINNHTNGNISINALSGDLYLGYQNTSTIYCRSGSWINLDAGNFSSYALPLTGGTIAANTTTDTPLTIRSGDTDSYIRFENKNGTILGYYGINANKQPVFYQDGDKVILHSNNYSSYALPIGGGRIQGDLKVNTNSGTNGFFIERLGGGEYTKIYQDDSSLYFNMYNDETNCNIYFNMKASDIESGGGAGANSGAVSFHLRNGKTTIAANYFDGTAGYANSAGAVAWNNITGKPEAFMPLSNQNNYVRVYNSSNINGGSTKVSVNDLAKQGFAAAMINSATDNPLGSAKWVHAFSMAWGADVNTSWISQLAMGVDASDGFWYRTTKGTCVGAAWKRVLDETNYSTYALPKSGGILTGNLTLSSSKHLQMIYNNTTYSVVHNHNNGNISIDATGKALYLGFKNTTGIYCRGSYVNLDSGNYTDYAATKGHDHGQGYAPMGSYTLATGKSVDITFNSGTGSCVVSCQGTLGNAHSMFMYTGYGSGGTVRSRIIALDSSPNITAQVLNSNGLKITNNTGQNIQIGVVSIYACGWPTFTASSTAANYSGVQRLVNGTNIVYSAPSSSSYYGDVCFLVT